MGVSRRWTTQQRRGVGLIAARAGRSHSRRARGGRHLLEGHGEGGDLVVVRPTLERREDGEVYGLLVHQPVEDHPRPGAPQRLGEVGRMVGGGGGGPGRGRGKYPG